MRRLVGFVVIAGACSVPSPKLRIGFSGGPSQACPSTECAEVALSCDAVMGIRIYDPAHPDEVLHQQCDRIQPNKESNLCAYKSINLTAAELPVKDLEVQIAFYPLSRVAYDASTKTYTCPPAVEYTAATGFPVEKAPTPALGGRGYYHPGDEEVDVTVGCTDLAAINDDPTCVASSSAIQVTATVTDFATRLPVASGRFEADQLRVAVGEPQPFDGGYILNPVDEVELKLHDALTPSWIGELDRNLFTKYLCLDVLQFAAETTGVLECGSARIDGSQLNLGGVRLQRNDLRKILRALANMTIPEEGLTIGIVLDGTSRGAPNYEVKPMPVGPSVTYVTNQGEAFNGTKTTDSGIFVSMDAPFGTVFSTMGGVRPTMSAVGGNVAGKVTVVILPPAGSQ